MSEWVKVDRVLMSPGGKYFSEEINIFCERNIRKLIEEGWSFGCDYWKLNKRFEIIYLYKTFMINNECYQIELGGAFNSYIRRMSDGLSIDYEHIIYTCFERIRRERLVNSRHLINNDFDKLMNEADLPSLFEEYTEE